MSGWQIIAELGGIGAVANMGQGLLTQAFGGYRQHYLDKREQDRLDKGEEDEDVEKKLDRYGNGAWVTRFIVIVAMSVISATVWIPLLNLFATLFIYYLNACCGTDLDPISIACVWYWPKDGSFLILEWERMKPFRIGPETADITFGILPIFFAISTNIVSFYLLNRVRKKL